MWWIPRENLSAENLFSMFSPPVEPHDSQKSLFELLVGEGVAEWVDGAVDVAQPIRDAVKGRRYAPSGIVAEAHDHGEDVPRCPTQHEGAQDYGDGS